MPPVSCRSLSVLPFCALVLAVAVGGCRTVPVGSRTSVDDGLVIEESRLRPASPPLSTYTDRLAASDDSLT